MGDTAKGNGAAQAVDGEARFTFADWQQARKEGGQESRQEVEAAQKDSPPSIQKGLTADVLERVNARPDRIAIVAMGRSHITWTSMCAAKGRPRPDVDEVWAINGMGALIVHDRLFMMDDLHVRTIPASQKKPGGCAGGMLTWLPEHPGPVYTTEPYPEVPGHVAYPLQDVLRATRANYINNSVAYAVAYAMTIGVKEMGLYGADFTYPERHVGEAGRGCVEFLLGRASMSGMTIKVAHDSTLMDAGGPRKFYGYAREPKLSIVDDEICVEIIRDPGK